MCIRDRMKTFIDRTVPRYLDIRDKEFYFILAAAEDNRANMERKMCIRDSPYIDTWAVAVILYKMIYKKDKMCIRDRGHGADCRGPRTAGAFPSGHHAPLYRSRGTPQKLRKMDALDRNGPCLLYTSRCV